MRGHPRKMQEGKEKKWSAGRERECKTC